MNTDGTGWNAQYGIKKLHLVAWQQITVSEILKIFLVLLFGLIHNINTLETKNCNNIDNILGT